MAGNESFDALPTQGVAVRQGARVLLFDDEGRLLLLKGHDPHLPARTWWFTPGGGVEPGESDEAAAARELAEETGVVVTVYELEGPVWDRTAVFDFMSRPYVQHERFFLARFRDAAPECAPTWTDAERETIDEVAWLTHEQVAHAVIEVFPAELREPWEPLLAWDGVTRSLGTAHE